LFAAIGQPSTSSFFIERTRAGRRGGEIIKVCGCGDGRCELEDLQQPEASAAQARGGAAQVRRSSCNPVSPVLVALSMNYVPSPLGAHLSYWLRHVSNQVSYALGRRLDIEGVTVAEWALLRELFDCEPVAPGRLADRLGLTDGAISKLAYRLTDKGLVTRQADPDDGRAHRLALSQEGRTLVPRLAAVVDDSDLEFFGHLSAQAREQIRAVLKEIVERRGLQAASLG
jgi:DNA-binding MarR family transcriptional regulator